MVQAQDLRIGNWLYDTKGKPAEVNEIKRHPSTDRDFAHIVTFYGLGHFGGYVEDLEPIPLSPVILESAGFREWSKGHWKLPEIMCLNGWSNEFNYYQPYKVLSIYTGNVYLEHLHQLQNLFYSLTGEELTIDINALTEKV